MATVMQTMVLLQSIRSVAMKVACIQFNVAVGHLLFEIHVGYGYVKNNVD